MILLTSECTWLHCQSIISESLLLTCACSPICMSISVFCIWHWYHCCIVSHFSVNIPSWHAIFRSYTHWYNSVSFCFTFPFWSCIDIITTLSSTLYSKSAWTRLQDCKDIIGQILNELDLQYRPVVALLCKALRDQATEAIWHTVDPRVFRQVTFCEDYRKGVRDQRMIVSRIFIIWNIALVSAWSAELLVSEWLILPGRQTGFGGQSYRNSPGFFAIKVYTIPTELSKRIFSDSVPISKRIHYFPTFAKSSSSTVIFIPCSLRLIYLNSISPSAAFPRLPSAHPA